MDERAVRAPEHPHASVHEAEPEADEQAIARKAQHEPSPGEPCRHTRQPHAIGGAADDAVEDDHVRRIDSLRLLDDVCDPELHTLLEALIAGELAGVRLPRPDELADLAALGARR